MNDFTIDIDHSDLTASFHVNQNPKNDFIDENSEEEYFDAPLCQAHVTCCLKKEKKSKNKKNKNEKNQ
jgi:hypothetical protein